VYSWRILFAACNRLASKNHYGTVLFHDATKDDIERHLDWWGRWLSLYPDRKGWWNEPEADKPDDPLEVSVRGLLRLKPCHVLDFLQHFVVFETKKGKTTKKIARYQQFEAVNDIVERTVSQKDAGTFPRAP
jgi:type I restriction enzyme R subunit